MKNIAVIGATSIIAQSCIKELLKFYDCEKITLVARNKEKLEDLVTDLKCRFDIPNVNSLIQSDFTDPVVVKNTVDSICNVNNNAIDIPDLVIIAQGSSLPDNHCLQEDLVQLKGFVELNAISPILFAEAFASIFEKNNKGHLVVIGSVAGDRGRKSNYIYGASKDCLSVYIQGLSHRFYRTNVYSSIIKPGPTLSPLTEKLVGKVNLASPEETSAVIVKGIIKKRRVIYAPAKWRLIMMIIRNLPYYIFGRMNI